MKITSYNHHGRLLSFPSVFVLKQRLPGFESSLRSYPINFSHLSREVGLFFFKRHESSS
jgi:hypothetical protein